MGNFNFRSALITSGMTISGFIGVLLVAFQLVDSSYKNHINGLEYQINLLKYESEKILQLSQSSKEDTEKNFLELKENLTDNQKNIIEICNLIIKEKEISVELKNTCKLILLES